MRYKELVPHQPADTKTELGLQREAAGIGALYATRLRRPQTQRRELERHHPHRAATAIALARLLGAQGNAGGLHRRPGGDERQAGLTAVEETSALDSDG